VIVVGSGPNGMAAAVTLARAGLFGARDRGSRPRSAGAAGPRSLRCPVPPRRVLGGPSAGRRLPVLHRHRRGGLGGSPPRGRHRPGRARGPAADPEGAFAHALDGGRAAAAAGSVEETAASLGPDGRAYRRLVGPLVRDMPLTLARDPRPAAAVRARASGGPGPVRPGGPAARQRPGPPAARRPGPGHARRGGRARHAPAHHAADRRGRHAVPDDRAHGRLAGWWRGGSAGIIDALARGTHLAGRPGRDRPLGGLPRRPASSPCGPARRDPSVSSWAWPAAGSGPGTAGRCGGTVTAPGVCKVDWALSGPVPWQAPACREAGTVHLGGEFARSPPARAEVAAGAAPAAPVLA